VQRGIGGATSMGGGCCELSSPKPSTARGQNHDPYDSRAVQRSATHLRHQPEPRLRLLQARGHQQRPPGIRLRSQVVRLEPCHLALQHLAGGGWGGAGRGGGWVGGLVTRCVTGLLPTG